MEPVPDRQQTTLWSTFLKAHWDVLAAIDFTTLEVWTARGLVTVYLLFVMELRTRRVHFAGCTPHPHEAWMKQTARQLTDWEGLLDGKRYLIMDRDTKFCQSFRGLLTDSGVEPVILPPRSPNLNAHMERFMRSIKEECLSKMIFFGQTSLRRAVTEYLEHFHHERNHQGLENQIIDPSEEVGCDVGVIRMNERLGGILKYYHREAA